MRNFLFGIFFLVSLSGCYANAMQARVHQTMESDEWGCFAKPLVRCPNRPNGQCTGHDSRWQAMCPDDGSVWVCNFVVNKPGAAFLGTYREGVLCHRY